MPKNHGMDRFDDKDKRRARREYHNLKDKKNRNKKHDALEQDQEDFQYYVYEDGTF